MENTQILLLLLLLYVCVCVCVCDTLACKTQHCLMRCIQLCKSKEEKRKEMQKEKNHSQPNLEAYCIIRHLFINFYVKNEILHQLNCQIFL